MQRAFRECKEIGCRKLTRDAKGYCEDHLHLEQESNIDYKRYRTDKKEQAFYSSAIWKKVRWVALSRDHGLCQQCLKDGKVTVADVIHHIIELKINWMLRLDLNNLLSLCSGCHNKLHKSNI